MISAIPVTTDNQIEKTMGPPRLVALSLFVASLLSLQCCKAPPNPEIGKSQTIDCPVELPEAAVANLDVSCSFINVPERHDRPEGPVIRIAVAQFRSPIPEAAPDPIVLNTGGPGDSNFEGFLPALTGPVGEALLSQRDVVVIELRGLYHSDPNLVAEEVFAAQLDLATRDVRGPEANEVLLEAMRKTHDRFIAEGIDLAAFNNKETAADIAFIMGALGYDRFNLFGSSAGTLVAQNVMRDYPQRLRSVVLNAAVPYGPALFREMLPSAARNLKRYFDMCAVDAACAEAYPDAERRFFGLLDALNATPVELVVKYPDQGSETTLLLNGDKLSSWLFASMYWNTQIPYTLERFHEGDFSAIQNSPEIFFPMRKFSYALGYTVILATSQDFTASSDGIPDRYLAWVDGLSLFFSPRLMDAVGDFWTTEPLPSALFAPIKSDVPTLVLNGRLDHVIPSEAAAELVAGLDNGHSFVFEGVAHSPIDAGTCGMEMMLAFVADPSVAPDASCMAPYKHEFQLPE
jgi:pimeloyl-ACP methyl ester carboxylesterase